MKNKWVKYTFGGVGALVAGIALMLGATMMGHTAISSLAGLAVAQTATLWNNVIDAAKGDAQQSGILATSTYLYNGATFDRVRGTSGSMNVSPTGATTPADAFANPTTAILDFSLNAVFNGTTWDRRRSATADALASTGMAAVGNMAFNGSTFDRIRSASATNNTATTSLGVQQITPISTWSVIDTDVGATQTIASRAAGGGTVRHVATSVHICYNDTVLATGSALVHLRDGATGAGTILKTWVIGIPVAGDSKCIDISGLNRTGTGNTAMTLEFAAAQSATATTSVTLEGYSTP